MSYLYLERFPDQNKALNNHVMLFLDIITWEKNICLFRKYLFLALLIFEVNLPSKIPFLSAESVLCGLLFLFCFVFREEVNFFLNLKSCGIIISLWRRKWQPTPVFLPRESCGQRSLVGLPSMGLHRVGHNWSDLACVHACIISLNGFSPKVANYIANSNKKQHFIKLTKSTDFLL